ncbi:MAG: RsmB/NOP family class I SAM-dependent RNA methyltransferase [Lachnospiraceae bacterium]|nr:RsmB/NOP family class I SAM-dependent RNA methyltransferase [Lachnospiraceae bacterium]
MERLPRDFVARMNGQLKEEAEAFWDAFEEAPHFGIRVNTGKLSAREAAGKLPFPLRPIPWTENGFYLEQDVPVARHPYYFAGLYYIQEPSAMLPAALLPVRPDDRVLDLCAAPGGKATELASRLTGGGLLVANDVSAGRAGALLKNLTLWGAPNICITVETPQRLLESFGCYFDKILVDAPCSGEGMFRKDGSLISAWKKKGSSGYTPLQKEILSAAVRMLKPGGMLLYSTCTFSPEEDEDVVYDALRRNPELELLPVPMMDGFCGGIASTDRFGSYAEALTRCVRIYPHRVDGEGHFLALLQKKGQSSRGNTYYAESAAHTGTIPKSVPDLLSVFSCRKSQTAARIKGWRWKQFGEKWLLVPPQPLPSSLRYLRTGLLAGTLKNGRFEPSQALAMLPDAPLFFRFLDLSAEDERIIRYLKGESLELTEAECSGPGLAEADGCLPDWVLLCVDGYGLGWCRLSGGRLKNKYYPGWRMQ